ncbi:MAG: DUF4258 domain-containing protein [Oscillospiraceae bacterium]|nr:DUF4258 domain-containing protein [Oscillospiraceae bacterium]
MIDITELRKLVLDIDNIIVTKHTAYRFRERGIKLCDVCNTILNGEIIEQYPDDYPYPSCLILGLSVGGKSLHVCVGLGDGKLFIITAYYPATDKWNADMKTRKVGD